jgi:F-type H+/Na+-transporting ATPase subunit alpha
VSIFAGVRGYLDGLEVGKIGRFEQSLLGEVKARHKDILDAIRTDRELKPATEEKLKGVLDQFVKTFA